MSRPHVYKILIIIVTIIAICALVTSLLISYLNNTFIPLRLKNLVTEKLTEYTKHTVTINSLRFSLKDGFILKDIKIYDNPEEKDALLFKADSAAFHIFLMPSLKKQRIIIPSINLSGAYLNLKRCPDGTWNISSLFQSRPGNETSRISVILKEFLFDNSKLLFKDNYPKTPISKEIISLTGTAGLSLPNKLSIRCDGKIDNNAIYIALTYKIKQKEMSLELRAEDLKIGNYADTYLSTNIGLIRSGMATASIKARILSFKTIQANGSISIKGLSAKIKDTDLTGNYTLNGNANIDIEDPSNMKYSVDLETNGTKISNSIKLLGNISNMEGTLDLNEKVWVIKNLSWLCYGSAVNADGKIEMPHKDFIAKINLRSDMSLKNISEDIDVMIESGKAKINAKALYRKDGSYEINGTSDIKELRLLQKNILLSGDFLISGKSTGIVSDWQSLEYKGTIDFNNAQVKSSNLLPFISKAAGKALFTTRSISIKKLTGTVAETNILLTGNLDYRKEKPDMLLHLKTGKLSVAKLISILPEDIKTRFKDIDAKGVCQLNLDFKGEVGNPETYGYAGSISLNKCSLNLEYWPYNISDIDCDVDFKGQQVTWNDLTFSIKDKRYTSSGRLDDFTQPSIFANIKSDILSATCEAKTGDNKVIFISKLDGLYRNSSFSFKGLINDLETAYADINGDIYLNLKDAEYIVTKKSQMLENLKLNGTVKLTLNMKGPLREPVEWALFVEGSSKAIGLAGLTLKDFYMDYRMKDNFIDIPVISVYTYGGIININSRANLKAKERPYIINMDIKDIDLHELIKDTKDKDKKIKGLLASKAVLNGYLNQKDSLHGNGWLQVSDGYLWEFPVLRGVMDIILMVPPENIVLTDAFGNFTIGNNKVYTEDFKLLSKIASLLWVGSIGFDTTLDFNITGRFAENVIKQTTEPGRIANALLYEASSLIMEVNLTGTLKNPIYQIVPFPLKRIFKEKVMDRLNDIFGNIVE